MKEHGNQDPRQGFKNPGNNTDPAGEENPGGTSDPANRGDMNNGSSTPRSLRVLVAEDDPINQRLMGVMLTRIGHMSDFAANGQIVMNKLQQEDYDALLLDMHMPVMDGYEVLRHLRSNRKLSSLLVIAYTASAVKGEEQDFLDAGCDDYLPKPVEQKTLAVKLHRALPRQ